MLRGLDGYLRTLQESALSKGGNKEGEMLQNITCLTFWILNMLSRQNLMFSSQGTKIWVRKKHINNLIKVPNHGFISGGNISVTEESVNSCFMACTTMTIISLL